MARRHQQTPWKSAGRVSEQMLTGDDVVRATGWVFNNATGDSLTLGEFVATGDDEVPAYLETFGHRHPDNQDRTLVEIGSGIGRMTCAFTREFGTVIACDLDPGFLERCHETVGRFGKVDRLRTLEVGDGRTLGLGDGAADVAFSYITFQHCSREDAMALANEAVRVVRPGGTVMLNFRGPAGSDAVLVPAGRVVRALYRMPAFGTWLARRRTFTRFAWQVSRVHPTHVLSVLGAKLGDIEVWTNPGVRYHLAAAGGVAAERRTFEGINPHHWWLIARVTHGV